MPQMIPSDPEIVKVVNMIRMAEQYSQIEEIGNYIVAHNQINQIDLIRRLEYLFTDQQCLATLQLKMNIFEVMSALLLTAKKDKFIRHCVTRLDFFLKKYSLLISENRTLSMRVFEIFKKWQENKIFSVNFYQRLRQSAKSIYKYNTIEKKDVPIFTKYSKHFLLSLHDVLKVEVAKNLYDSHQLKKSAENDAIGIRDNYELLKSINGEQQKKRRGRELREEVERTIDKLVQSLKFNLEGAHQLERMILKERDFLQLDTKKEDEKE